MRRTATVTLFTLGALVAPASAQAATTLASGTLRDMQGQPTAGTVTAFAWLRHHGSAESPVIGVGNAGIDGRYTVRATDERRLATLAAPRGGSLDLILRADDGKALGETVVTAHPHAAGARASAFGGAVPSANITTRWKHPLAKASQICLGYHDVYISEQTVPGVIGEINNVYKDTRASFAYGSKADSSVSVAFKPDTGDAGFGPDGSVTVDNELETQDDLNGKAGPYARQITSDFRLVEYYSFSECPGLPNGERIRAEEWVGGIGDSRKLRGTLRVCPKSNRRQTLRYPPGGGFRRASRKAVKYEGGLQAFGLGFAISSGYSQWVREAFRFGGVGEKQHYICGSRPNVGPKYAPRIFSGAQPGS